VHCKLQENLNKIKNDLKKTEFKAGMEASKELVVIQDEIAKLKEELKKKINRERELKILVKGQLDVQPIIT
jgi:hypothetical protein